MEGRINFNETMGDKNVFDLLLLTSDSDCWSTISSLLNRHRDSSTVGVKVFHVSSAAISRYQCTSSIAPKANALFQRSRN